jgi:hypothetical protein
MLLLFIQFLVGGHSTAPVYGITDVTIRHMGGDSKSQIGWHTLPSLKEPRVQRPAVHVIHDRLIVFGGSSFSFLSSTLTVAFVKC